MSELTAELARLGTATVYEAAGREGLVDCELVQVVPGSRAAGPARTVRCAQGDNLTLRGFTARTADKEPKWRVKSSELLTGYQKTW